jgi:hypothetical protein
MSFDTFKKIDIKKSMNDKTASEIEMYQIKESKCSLFVDNSGLNEIKNKINDQFKKAHDTFSEEKKKLVEDKKNFDADFDSLNDQLNNIIEEKTKNMIKGSFKTEAEAYKKKMIEDIKSSKKIFRFEFSYDSNVSEISKFKNNVERQNKKLLEKITKEKKEAMGKEIQIKIKCKLKVSGKEYNAEINKLNPGSNKIYGTYTNDKNATKSFDVTFNTLCQRETQSGGNKRNLGMKGGSRDEISTDELC